MNGIILALCFVLSLTKGESADLVVSNNSEYAIEDYIDVNRQRYEEVLAENEAKVKRFADNYVVLVDDIFTENELIIEKIIYANQRLDSLSVINPSNRECVSAHKNIIPHASDVEYEIDICSHTAMNELTATLQELNNTLDNMKDYYINYFKKNPDQCAENEISCYTDAVARLNDLFSEQQKSFLYQLEAAVCTANANIKKGIDCTFDVVTSATEAIAHAEVLVDDCRLGTEICEACKYYCPSTLSMLQDKLQSQEMPNPFHGNSDFDCFIVQTLTDESDAIEFVHLA